MEIWGGHPTHIFPQQLARQTLQIRLLVEWRTCGQKYRHSQTQLIDGARPTPLYVSRRGHL